MDSGGAADDGGRGQLGGGGVMRFNKGEEDI